MQRRHLLRLATGASAILLLDACAPAPSAGGGAPAQPTGAPATSAAPKPTSAPQPTQAQAAQPTQVRRGGLLRVGLDVDADTLDPRLTKNTSGFRMKELAFNGLVAINPNTRTKGAIAAKNAAKESLKAMASDLGPIVRKTYSLITSKPPSR